jgi:hypothetical protein
VFEPVEGDGRDEAAATLGSLYTLSNVSSGSGTITSYCSRDFRNCDDL